ncbi:MP65 Cell surface mannoprotein MP65 [Candida maltosa Xu316]|uniref:Glycosyl hydrolase, putative n=1 Tax=Candida maltosa (strain Xu316) TaxID=1245528 RepID=M3K3L9_CANMX|nr:Glycosyl hydrolase, putative [Candida maltosa Xu316]
MLFKSLVTFAILAQALAAPAVHQHHQHKEEKRAVHVVTETNVVVVTLGNGEQTTTFEQPTFSVATGVTVTPVTEAAQDHPTTTVEAATEPETSPASSASAPSTGDVSVGAGGAKGVTYSPYSDDGGCKSSSQIASEVAQLSGFNIIRLYGVDCDQVAQVLKAKTADQKIFAGIFDVSNIGAGVQAIADAVNANGSWDDIYTVSVGNELVNSGAATPAQIGSYVSQARSALKSAGYSGSVVSVDTFIAVINNPELCSYSDYMAVNAHAFFDGYITAENAGPWVLLQIQRVWSACGGKKNVLITETGWPSQGDNNGVAVPSKPNQQAAISSIKSTCGDSSVLFTAFNDLWKVDGPYNAEKYWGILSPN